MNECDINQAAPGKRWLFFFQFWFSLGRGNGFHPSVSLLGRYILGWNGKRVQSKCRARSGAMFWVESLPIRVKTCWSIFVIEGCGSIILIILDQFQWTTWIYRGPISQRLEFLILTYCNQLYPLNPLRPPTAPPSTCKTMSLFRRFLSRKEQQVTPMSSSNK
jgi:hypothetical protein